MLDDEARPPARGALDRAWRSSSRARCTRSTRCSASAARSARRSSCTRRRRGGRRRVPDRVGELLELVGLPARRARRLPAPALRRPAPARADRARARVRPAAAGRRRADDRARRDGAGPGAAAAATTCSATFGLAVLFITHDLSTLAAVCRRLAVMYAGRIVEEGPSDEVFAAPAHPYTRALAAAFPVIGDPAFRMGPSGLAGDPPDPRDLPPGCPFHPRCPVARRGVLDGPTVELCRGAGTAGGVRAGARGEPPVVATAGAPRGRVGRAARRAGPRPALPFSSCATSRCASARATARSPAPSTASSLDGPRGRGARARRRVGVRQDDARAHDPRARAARARARCASRASRSATTPARSARYRRAGADGLPGPDRRAQRPPDDLRGGRRGSAHPEGRAATRSSSSRPRSRGRASARRSGSSACTRTRSRAASVSAW